MMCSKLFHFLYFSFRFCSFIDLFIFDNNLPEGVTFGIKLNIMNCSPVIAIALLLLSLTAGMFLLYKTQKESLGILFKIAGWFIIVVSIACMVHCSIHCVFRCGKGNCGGMEQCGPGGGDCGWQDGKQINKRVMICKEGGEECGMGSRGMGHGCCQEMMEGCEDMMEECEEGEMDCCKMRAEAEGGMKMEKDTVIVKKK